MQELAALARRYDRPGPRYTSYPTVPVWTDGFGEEEYRAALSRSSGDELSLYVHIPFCERLCAFCACNRTITRDRGRAAAYLDGLERESELLREALGRERRGVQLAVGGGSPNFLSAEQLARLASLVERSFPALPGAERSIELDPRATTAEQIEVLAECGFNRLSFGVQDLDPRVQHAIRRVQPLERVESLTRLGRRRGVRSINYDLMYGLPYQTEASFDRTLDAVLSLRPDRIALYSYAHVTWVAKAQRGFARRDLPSAERKLAIFALAVDRLVGAGYRFLGLDHFALPEDDLARSAEDGEMRRNFMGYTTRAGLDLLALGASGISELSDAYAQSEKDPDGWLAAVRDDRLPTVRGWRLTRQDALRRDLIQELMCRGRIPLEVLPELEAKLAPLLEDGLLSRKPREYAVTPLGRFFLRVIAMSLDAYLPDAEGGTPRFSRTV